MNSVTIILLYFCNALGTNSRFSPSLTVKELAELYKQRKKDGMKGKVLDETKTILVRQF